MIPRFKKSRFEPKPIETDYWIDINSNEYGGVLRYYDTNKEIWKQIESITTEIEPKFTSSPAATITTANIADWNDKVERSELVNLKEDILASLDTTSGVTVGMLEYYVNLLNDSIDKKANKATTLNGYGITDAYDKKEIDDKLKDVASSVEIPTKVSQLVNDSKYVTESELASKLPSDIVSDANYIHTDNNYTTEEKTKLAGLSNYDDTEIKEDIDTLSSTDETLRAAISLVSTEVNTKANLDDVYTREYLDTLFNSFVTKTHRTYGFLDERPTDLEQTDTGFIYYDYSVNEPLIWVADRWRLLVSNTPIAWYLPDDELTAAINKWSYTNFDGTDLCLLTRYVPAEDPEYDLSTDDIYAPNTVVNKFVLEVGENAFDEYPTISVEDKMGTVYSGTYWGQPIEISFIYKYDNAPIPNVIVRDFSKVTDADNFHLYNALGFPVTEIKNKTEGDYFNLYSNATTKIVNSLILSKGIKNINIASFAKVTPSQSELIIPSGVNLIGDLAFADTGITSVTFPNNPIKISYRAFSDNNLSEFVFPSTLDYDYIKEGGSRALCYKNKTEMTLTIPNGTKAIPGECFYITTIKNYVTFPNSLEYIGAAAFYDSGISGEIDTNNVEHIGDYAFRNHKLSKVVIGEKLKYLFHSAFWTNTQGVTTTLILNENLELLGNYALPYMNYAKASLVVPAKLKEIGTECFCYYGWSNVPTTSSEDVLTYHTENQQYLVLKEGLECIGPMAFSNTGFTGELILPESLKYVGRYAFQHGYSFSNTKLFIPKNLECIGGLPTVDYYNAIRYPELYEQEEGKYGLIQLKGYIEQGGTVEREDTSGAFYGLAGCTLKEYEVDPENQWYKSIDGVLYTKDGKAALAYPPQKEGDTFEIPEGVEHISSYFLYRHGYKAIVPVKQADGVTFVDTPAVSSYPTDSSLICNGLVENPLRTIILPNTFKSLTPREHKERFPYTSSREYSTLTDCFYFVGIERFLVKDDNPYYKNEDDWLLSKDGTELIVLAPGRKGDVTIPDSVTTILPGFTGLAGIPDDELCLENSSPSYTASGAGYYASYAGIYLHIGAGVINVTDFVLRELTNLNLHPYCAVYIDSENPAIEVAANGYIVRKETAE